MSQVYSKYIDRLVYKSYFVRTEGAKWSPYKLFNHSIDRNNLDSVGLHMTLHTSRKIFSVSHRKNITSLLSVFTQGISSSYSVTELLVLL